MKNFNYNFENLSDLGALAGIFIFLFIIFMIILVSFIVVYVVGKWKLFQKAGKNGWEAIIPFYSDWVYVEIAGLNTWWFLLLVANTVCSLLNLDELGKLAWIASLVGAFFCNYNISKKLHKDTGFAVLMTLFAFIMIPIVGISKNYTWDDSVLVSKNGPISDNKDNNISSSDDNTKDKKEKTNNEVKYCSKCGKENNRDAKFCSNCGKEI